MSSVVNRTYDEGLKLPRLEEDGVKDAVKTTLATIKKLWWGGLIGFYLKLPSLSLEDKNAIIYVAADQGLWAKVCSELSKTWNGSHTQLCMLPQNIRQQILDKIAIRGVHYNESKKGEITPIYA